MVQLYHNRNVNKNSLLFKVDYTSLNVIFPDKSFGDTDKQIHYSFFVIHKSTNYHYLITSK